MVKHRYDRTVAWLIAGALLALAVGLLIGFNWKPHNVLREETGKLLVQLMFVVVVGAVVTAVIEHVRRERERRERARTDLNEVFDALKRQADDAYVEVKKLRRLARLKLPSRLVGGDLEETSVALMEQQLVVELLRRQVEALQKAISIPDAKSRETLSKTHHALENLDSYLNGIWTEYEGRNREREEPRDLPKLYGFLAQKDDPISTFSTVHDGYMDFVTGILELKLSEITPTAALTSQSPPAGK